MTIDKLKEKIIELFNDDFLVYHLAQDEFGILESDANAKIIKEVRIKGKNSIELKKDVLEKINVLFSSTSKNDFSFQNGCDGIIIYKDEEVFTLVLIELKDSFTERSVRKALHQFEATNTKIKWILELIHEFGFEMKVKAMIISQMPINHIENLTIASKCTNRCNPEYYAMGKNGHTIYSIHKSCSNNWPIKDKYKFDRIPVKLVEGNNKLVEL